MTLTDDHSLTARNRNRSESSTYNHNVVEAETIHVPASHVLMNNSPVAVARSVMDAAEGRCYPQQQLLLLKLLMRQQQEQQEKKKRNQRWWYYQQQMARM